MQSEIEQVIRTRRLVLTLIRGLAVALIIMGALPILALASYAFVVTPYNAISNAGPSPAVDWGDAIIRTAADVGQYIFAALLLLAIQQYLVRWLVPMPRPECPQCGYDIANLTESRCPECGLQLPESKRKTTDDETP